MTACQLLIFGLFMGVAAGPVQDAGPTTLILVRHAEKAADASNDPDLTAAGRLRAEELAVLLRDIDIAAVYATPFKRARRTAAPVAGQKKLTVREYGQGTEQDFIRDVLARHRGETVLIVGHSNTVARMANAAAGREIYADLADSDYDSLFMAVVDAAGGTVVHRLRFGVPRVDAKTPSPPAETDRKRLPPAQRSEARAAHLDRRLLLSLPPSFFGGEGHRNGSERFPSGP